MTHIKKKKRIIKYRYKEMKQNKNIKEDFIFKMPNYQQGKIYSIRSHSRPDLIYIGSTTQPLSKRMGLHRDVSSRCSSKEIIAVGDAYIELIENFPCNDKYELNARENRHMRAVENVVNTRSAQADCPHGRKQCQCIDCGGASICEHQRMRDYCSECSPAECDFCNKTYSKGDYLSHLKSLKHKKNYTAEFKRVFDANMTIEDVPEY